MNMTQSKQRRSTTLAIGAAAISALFIVGGCATERPTTNQNLEQRIENARTETDHRDIANTYDQQANADKALAEKHRNFAKSYAKSWTPAPPWNNKGGATTKGNPAMVKHCENLANLYEQASKANLELAASHRSAALGETK